MDLANMWVIDIVGPAILLILLIGFVISAGSSSGRDSERTGQLNRDTGGDDEQRRRSGTDGL